MEDFWNTTVPDEWKKQDWKKAPKRRKKKYDTRCNNPFHYLKRHSNFSLQRETRCPCSVAERVQRCLKSRDIRSFLKTFPRIHLPDSSVMVGSSLISECRKSTDYYTRDDLIRGEHDRGKKERRVG